MKNKNVLIDMTDGQSYCWSGTYFIKRGSVFRDVTAVSKNQLFICQFIDCVFSVPYTKYKYVFKFIFKTPNDSL